MDCARHLVGPAPPSVNGRVNTKATRLDDVEWLAARRNDGWSDKRIAAELGLSAERVRDTLRRHSLPKLDRTEFTQRNFHDDGALARRKRVSSASGADPAPRRLPEPDTGARDRLLHGVGRAAQLVGDLGDRAMRPGTQPVRVT